MITDVNETTDSFDLNDGMSDEYCSRLRRDLLPIARCLLPVAQSPL
jgi:hypothetical protein